MYNTNFKKAMIIIISFVLLIGFCVIFNLRNAVAVGVDAAMAMLREDEFELVIYKDAEISQGGIYSAQKMYVKSWFNNNDEKLYFFVPHMSENESEWKYVFNQYDAIEIDGEKIKNGMKFQLREGTHLLKAENNMQIPLEVIYSDNLFTMFIEMDPEKYEGILASRDESAKGDFWIFDEKTGDLRNAGIIENMHTRGNLSFTETDKKSFSIKLTEADSLLGMERSNKWLLLANSFDATLSRNLVAKEMAQILDMDYVPEAEYMNLYINGEYQGNYQLSEKVEIADGRLEIRDLERETESLNLTDISKEERVITEDDRLQEVRYVNLDYEPVDISSGYLLELDMFHRYRKEASGFLTSRYQPVVFKSPQYAGKNEVLYVADKYQNLENALCSENGYNAETEEYYYEQIDMRSFAQKYLIEEVTKNTDASLTSFFVYIPESDNRFYAGPIWDYDQALGDHKIKDGISLSDPNGFYASENIWLDVIADREYSLLYLLCQQKEFQNLYMEMYFEKLRADLDYIADDFIDSNAEKIEKSAVMNAVRWNVYEEINDLTDIQKRFREDNLDMGEFLKKRVEFLDEEWSK